MKKILLALAFILPLASFSQSNFDKEERLFLTCKIWGFLKYYHPEIGKGKVDWDVHLLEQLNQLDQQQNPAAFSADFVSRIEELGPLKKCKSCDKESKLPLFYKNFDLSWHEDPRLTNELQRLLKSVEKNRHQGRKRHYIGAGGVFQFEPKNETSLTDLDWSNEQNRLLVLFRYWNYIEYFFPYKYLCDQPWDETLKELIPKFLHAKTETEFHLAVLQLIVRIDDTHAGFISPALRASLTFKYLPVNLAWVEKQVIVTGIRDSTKAAAADLHPGDVLLTINGDEVQDIMRNNLDLIWGSNLPAKYRSVNYSLFYGMSDTIQVSIDRMGKKLEKEVTRYAYQQFHQVKKESDTWKLLDDSIGYVNMGILERSQVSEVMGNLLDKPAIILDVRNYPKGTYQMVSRYLKGSRTPFAKFTRPNFNYPGTYYWEGESYCGTKNEDPYQGQVILLFNEQTQSHAEFTCMCLQSVPGVITVGSQTAGADGNVSVFELFDGNKTAISGIGVYYPDGRETQRIGIVPDYEITPTVAGIRQGKDEVLEKALEIAMESINTPEEQAKGSRQQKFE